MAGPGKARSPGLQAGHGRSAAEFAASGGEGARRGSVVSRTAASIPGKAAPERLFPGFFALRHGISAKR